VSDANDATDTTAGRILPEGSVTYRVYIDLMPGSKLIKIYGDVYHALKISSTASFYNNIDRPDYNFGFDMNKSWFTNNPTLGLDSWLTIGRALRSGSVYYSGILKEDDTDGSFIGGTNNNGGTAAIAGGLLVNAASNAGIPVTAADGYFPDAATFAPWIHTGFEDQFNNNLDTTVFGPIIIGSEFISNNAFIQQTSGVAGVDAENRVLIAQLTTKGEISFELNVELEEAGGGIVKYVADNDTLLPGEVVSPHLTYPAACGCLDANYLEYDASFSCPDSTKCLTLIVFGCMDSMACNYNPYANFNIKELCCYPGHCNDRDISIVCPEGNERLMLYPNPSSQKVTILVSEIQDNNARILLYNSIGHVVVDKKIDCESGTFTFELDISGIASGIYWIRLLNGEKSYSNLLIKN
jgi:hypothetical protein